MNDLHSLLKDIEDLNTQAMQPICVSFLALRQHTLDEFEHLTPYPVELRLWSDYALETPFHNNENHVLIIGPDITEDNFVNILNRWAVLSHAIDHAPRVNITLVLVNADYSAYRLASYVSHNICDDIAQLNTCEHYTHANSWDTMVTSYQDKAEPFVQRKAIEHAIGDPIQTQRKRKV